MRKRNKNLSKKSLDIYLYLYQRTFSIHIWHYVEDNSVPIFDSAFREIHHNLIGKSRVQSQYKWGSKFKDAIHITRSE